MEGPRCRRGRRRGVVVVVLLLLERLFATSLCLGGLLGMVPPIELTPVVAPVVVVMGIFLDGQVAL